MSGQGEHIGALTTVLGPHPGFSPSAGVPGPLAVAVGAVTGWGQHPLRHFLPSRSQGPLGAASSNLAPLLGSDIPGIRPGGPGLPGGVLQHGGRACRPQGAAGARSPLRGLASSSVGLESDERASWCLYQELPGSVACTLLAHGCARTLCECPRISAFLAPVVKQAPGAALHVASAHSPRRLPGGSFSPRS